MSFAKIGIVFMENIVLTRGDKSDGQKKGQIENRNVLYV